MNPRVFKKAMTTNRRAHRERSGMAAETLIKITLVIILLFVLLAALRALNGKVFG
jgi:hypothetical protein